MKKTVSSLKKKADSIFSKFIRQRDKGICITCGKQDDPKRMQCGHYIRRSINILRYDEKNCNCQCQRCNIWMSGNMDEYALALEKKYGEGTLEWLHEKKQESKQWSVKELEEIIEHYKNLVHE